MKNVFLNDDTDILIYIESNFRIKGNNGQEFNFNIMDKNKYKLTISSDENREAKNFLSKYDLTLETFEELLENYAPERLL